MRSTIQTADFGKVRAAAPARVWLSLLLAVLLACPLPARAQGVEYYHLDGIGNVRAVTNQAGQVTERHDYLPFGEECTVGVCAGNPQVGAGQAKKFTGKERDTETSLDYFGARYYGNTLGRFTSVDPVLNVKATLPDPQRWNVYSYVSNRPLLLVDPDGREQPTVMNGKVVMGGVDGEWAGDNHAKNQMLAILCGSALVGILVASVAPELLSAGIVAGANPKNQALVQETLEGLAGGPPGVPSPLRMGGGIKIGVQGLEHVAERHTVGGAKSMGKSVFAAGEDLVALIKNAEGTQAVTQPNGRLQRIVDAGRAIGTDRATGGKTSLYTVITDKIGNLVTAFPGKP